MAVTLTDEGQDDMLNRLLVGESSNMRVGLFTAQAGSGKAVVLANITPCTFSGYAAQAPVFAAIADSAAGRSRQEATELVFVHNGGATVNSVLGWYLWHNITGKLWYYEPFGAAVTMDSNADQIKVKPTLYFGDLTAPL